MGAGLELHRARSQRRSRGGEGDPREHRRAVRASPRGPSGSPSAPRTSPAGRRRSRSPSGRRRRRRARARARGGRRGSSAFAASHRAARRAAGLRPFPRPRAGSGRRSPGCGTARAARAASTRWRAHHRQHPGLAGQVSTRQLDVGDRAAQQLGRVRRRGPRRRARRRERGSDRRSSWRCPRRRRSAAPSCSPADGCGARSQRSSAAINARSGCPTRSAITCWPYSAHGSWASRATALSKNFCALAASESTTNAEKPASANVRAEAFREQRVLHRRLQHFGGRDDRRNAARRNDDEHEEGAKLHPRAYSRGERLGLISVHRLGAAPATRDPALRFLSAAAAPARDAGARPGRSREFVALRRAARASSAARARALRISARRRSAPAQ